MLKILHVDRSEFFRKIIKEIVTRCGHSVECVSTLAAAEAALAVERVDLIITGIELDDGDAAALIRALGATDYRDVPVIVVTSADSLEQRERLFALGVVDYMLKNELSEDRFRRYFEALAAEDELSRFMRSLRVAVLDDSAMILKIITHILTLNGFGAVRCFTDPKQLFDSGENFDLYITDIVLPAMSGEQVVSRLRRDRPDAIILSMSKFTGEKPLANILLAGADDYIHKPFDSGGLMSRLKVNVRAFQLKKRLERLAVTDGLTDLYNHRYSYERLEEEAAKAARYGRPLSLAMLDIDDFKHINDTRGHRVGDQVLAALAKTLRDSLRSVDVVGRYGGEEFVAIFPETPLGAARVAAEKVRAAIECLKPVDDGLAVSVSIGLAEYRTDENIAAFVARADAELYQAKRSGKNRVVG
jgi:two-component system cell cycle response regulator